MRRINRQTLGQLLKGAKRKTDELTELEPLLATALEERNRLAHSFFRQHNLRRNSNAGRAIMIDDLHVIHVKVLAAWKAVNLLMGNDLDALVDQMAKSTGKGDGHGVDEDGPVAHLPI
jgi:hypothetical protein